MDSNGFETVLVTGGGGYVGSLLVPKLLEDGYSAKVIDLFWYGDDVFGSARNHPSLRVIPMDIRDVAGVRRELAGVDVVIHLACISNDPSFELDPDLGTSINREAFAPLLQSSIDQRVRRFIYASSSSVYGVKADPDVREDATPEPLTDYSRFKLECERTLLEHPHVGEMERVVLRPATVCGWAPRLRLDLTVNILTAHALVNKKIRIFGGSQLRPNINIQDMVRVYQTLLQAPRETIDGEAFNAGYQNLSVSRIAEIVKDTFGDQAIELCYEPSDDLRSYHINSDKIREKLGFVPRFTIEDAVQSLVEAFQDGKIRDPLTNPLYHNIKRMQQLKAQ